MVMLCISLEKARESREIRTEHMRQRHNHGKKEQRIMEDNPSQFVSLQQWYTYIIYRLLSANK